MARPQWHTPNWLETIFATTCILNSVHSLMSWPLITGCLHCLHESKQHCLISESRQHWLTSESRQLGLTFESTPQSHIQVDIARSHIRVETARSHIRVETGRSHIRVEAARSHITVENIFVPMFYTIHPLLQTILHRDHVIELTSTNLLVWHPRAQDIQQYHLHNRVLGGSCSQLLLI